MGSAIAAACLLALAAGCSPSKTAFQLGVPGAHVEMSVLRATPRGTILDVLLQAPG